MEGAKHGNWATDIQEYMIVPDMEKFKTFSEALRVSTEIFHTAHNILDEKGYSVGLGYEGAYAPKEMKGNEEAFDIILNSIQKAGFTQDDFKLAVDVAASEFYDENTQKYILRSEKKELSKEEWLTLQRDWYSQYPMMSIEDPLDEEDWEGWNDFTTEFGHKYMVVGDDLLCTNRKRIEKGIEEKAMNSVLIKLNQIGTVTETLDAIKTSVENGLSAICLLYTSRCV